jgi:acetyltransferase-like isoleucine patch superfamily enzyme
MVGYVSPLSTIDHDVTICSGVYIWHFAQIRNNAIIGENSIIGKSVYIGPGVKIGNNCKIQNQSQIYEPAEVADFVFIGPGVVLTNDRIPRATTPEGKLKGISDWKLEGVKILEGASIGANSTCIAPLTIGKWSMVGAGSVVVQNVANYSLVVGNPAKHIGWVGESGEKLVQLSLNKFKSPISQKEFLLENGELVPYATV